MCACITSTATAAAATYLHRLLPVPVAVSTAAPLATVAPSVPSLCLLPRPTPLAADSAPLDWRSVSPLPHEAEHLRFGASGSPSRTGGEKGGGSEDGMWREEGEAREMGESEGHMHRSRKIRIGG